MSEYPGKREIKENTTGKCMEKIVITGPFNNEMKQALESHLADRFEIQYITTPEEFGALEDADYTILRTLSYKAEDIAKMEKMKLIQRWGAGYDTVDIKAAAEKNIPVAIAYGINSPPVAEMAVALTLSVYRHLAEHTEMIMNGIWDRSYGARSYTINGKTAGIIGLGNIGKRVAALYQAFGAEVIYYDAYRLTAEMEEQLNVTYCDLDDIWEKCDIISLHAPATEDTVNMVNEGTLYKMRDKAVLINTARTNLVDLKALAAALRDGKLLGAGLDAIDPEITQDNPFKGLKNIVLSPHLGGDTADNTKFMA